ncbi:MAG: hypothetical protein ACLFVJ_05675 [Persicimonas sp.]
MFNRRFRRSSAIIIALMSGFVVSCGGGESGDAASTNNQTNDTRRGVTANEYVAPPPRNQPEAVVFHEDLIDEALDDGDIDEATALLYRVYASFGDPQLPEQYWGHRSSANGTGLMIEVVSEYDSLPEEIQSALDPFLRRPTDVESAFSAGGLTWSTGESENKCTEGWMSSASNEPDAQYQDLRWQVHICKRDDWEADLAAATAAMERYWGEASAENPDSDMIRDMGEPRADGEGLARVDLYLVEPGMPALRLDSDQEKELSTLGPARTVPVNREREEEGYGSGGYVLLDRGLLDRTDITFDHSLVHELFHVLTNTYNLDVVFEAPAYLWWWMDATAEWAAVHYVEPERRNVHESRFFPGTQQSPLSIASHATPYRRYEAYIWALYMAYSDGPDAIFQTWKAIDEVESFDQAQATVFDAFPPEDHFAEFTRWVFNAALPGNPIRERFVAADEPFPDNKLPAIRLMGREHLIVKEEGTVTIDYSKWWTEIHTDAGDYQVNTPDGVPGMGYRFDRVRCAESESPMEIAIEAGESLASVRTAHLDALARDPDSDEYHLITVDLSERTEFEATDLYLLFSNTARESNQLLSGSIDIEVTGTPCEPMDGVVHIWRDRTTSRPTGEDAEGVFAYGHTFLHGTLLVRLGERQPTDIGGWQTHEYPDTGTKWVGSGVEVITECVTTEDCVTRMVSASGQGMVAEQCPPEAPAGESCPMHVTAHHNGNQGEVGLSLSYSLNWHIEGFAEDPVGGPDIVIDKQQHDSGSVFGAWLDEAKRRAAPFSRYPPEHPEFPHDHCQEYEGGSDCIRVTGHLGFAN